MCPETIMGKLSINPTIKTTIPILKNPNSTPRIQIKILPSKLIRASSSTSTSSSSIVSSKNVKIPLGTSLDNSKAAAPGSPQTVRGQEIPTMEDILESSRAQNLDWKLQKMGPFFRITATSLETKRELGRAEGVIRVWFDGKLLHLDSIRLRRETVNMMNRSIFGVGLFLGAVAVRHGFDCGCSTAQLLAINDSELYHSKLVRFYSRIGFKVVHEVDGSSFGDLSHMLVWGGRGTRMDANIEDLLVKWCSRFKPRN